MGTRKQVLVALLKPVLKARGYSFKASTWTKEFGMKRVSLNLQGSTFGNAVYVNASITYTHPSTGETLRFSERVPQVGGLGPSILPLLERDLQGEALEAACSVVAAQLASEVVPLLESISGSADLVRLQGEGKLPRGWADPTSLRNLESMQAGELA